jgi:hypothetical protein
VWTVVYQKLASGTLDTVWISQGTTYEVTQAPLTIDPPVSPNLPVGPTYVLAYELDWYDPTTNNQVTEGREVVGYTHYWRFIGSPYQKFSESSVCNSIWPPYNTLIETTGAVGSLLNFYIYRYPRNVTVNVRWDGAVIGSVGTTSTGDAAGNVKVPASIMGPHTIKFTYGSWVSQATYTVKPRIKVTPSTASRGQVVNVSLRGYKGYEPVKIRWKKGDTFVQVAVVTTSSTGSANVGVVVPNFVPNGTTSVRGDGTYGHAQTNALTVSGGPFNSATLKTPTPTPTLTKTPSPTATAIVTTTTPPATATATVELPTEAPTETLTATPIASETATPSVEATSEVATDTPEPTETATPEPSPTVDGATATASAP